MKPTTEQRAAIAGALVDLSREMDAACICNSAGEGLPKDVDRAIYKTCEIIIEAGDAVRALAYKVQRGD